MAGLFRSMLSISAATVLSRATGYARAMTQAAVLGVGLVANAYAISALLPSLIYELFIGGILYSIFIPVLIERITNHGEEDARRLTNALFTLVLPLMAVLALLGIVFAEPLVRLVTDFGSQVDVPPEDVERTVGLAVLLFRVFAVQMLFYGITTIATGVLQAHRRFFLPTFAPVLNNLIIIASFGAYALLAPADETLAVYALALGVTVGVAVMALALLPTMWRLGYKIRPVFGHPALLSTAKLAAPMVVLVSASVGFQLFGSYLASGFFALAEFSYAFILFSLPYGIFAVAIATALMPELSEKFSRGDADGYRETFSFGLRTMAFVMVPASVGMIVLAEPLVGLLYERGRFDPQATDTVAALLVAYSVGLLGYSAYFFIVRAFYSRQDTKTPALLNVVIFGLYVVLALFLSRQEVMGLLGIPLAVSASYAVLTVVGLAAIRRKTKSVDGRRILRSLLKMLAAGAVMYAVAYGGVLLLGPGSGTLERAGILALVGSASLAAYLGAAFVLRTEELRSALSLLKRRLSRPGAGEAG